MDEYYGKEPDTIVDVGCSVGQWASRYISDAIMNSKMVGLDLENWFVVATRHRGWVSRGASEGLGYTDEGEDTKMADKPWQERDIVCGAVRDPRVNGVRDEGADDFGG